MLGLQKNLSGLIRPPSLKREIEREAGPDTDAALNKLNDSFLKNSSREDTTVDRYLLAILSGPRNLLPQIEGRDP